MTDVNTLVDTLNDLCTIEMVKRRLTGVQDDFETAVVTEMPGAHGIETVLDRVRQRQLRAAHNTMTLKKVRRLDNGTVEFHFYHNPRTLM